MPAKPALLILTAATVAAQEYKLGLDSLVSGGKLYKRAIRRQGYLPWNTFKPPMPHL